MGVGDVPGVTAAVEEVLERRTASDGVSAASGGAFSAFFGVAEQKSLFKRTKMVYNNRTKVPNRTEDRKRRRER